jgi:hypothetical protein
LILNTLPGVQLECSLSQTVGEMMANDLESIQRSQPETVSPSNVIEKESYGSACLDIVKQAIQMTEEVPAGREWLLNSLTDLRNQCSVWMQSNKPTRDELGIADAGGDDRITFPVGQTTE